MKKFKFLVLFGLKKRLLKKAFIITNVIIGLLVMGLINLPSIISMVQGDSEETPPLQVALINNTDEEAYPLETNLLAVLNASYMEYEYEATVFEEEATDAFWDQEDVDILLVFSGELASADVTVYAKDQTQQTFLTGQVQTVLNDYQDITYANFDIQSPPSTGDEEESTGDRAFVEGIVSILFLPVFMLIIMATQFLGVDIIEEKSTKAIETIIASVPAKVHFLSKITASLSFLIIQSTFLLMFVGFGALIEKLFMNAGEREVFSVLGGLAEQIPNWASLLSISIAFLLFGTLLFLTLAAFLASVATTQEDYQQYQAPLIFLLLGGYYVGIFLPMLGADGIVRVAAYIPFFSTIVAPIAYATGAISLLEGLLTLALTIATAILFLYVVAPIYRVAILSYEETKFFKRIRFYIKKAFSKS